MRTYAEPGAAGLREEPTARERPGAELPRSPTSGGGRAAQHRRARCKPVPFSGPTCPGRPATVWQHKPSSPRPTKRPPTAFGFKPGRFSALSFPRRLRFPAEVQPTDAPTRPQCFSDHLFPPLSHGAHVCSFLRGVRTSPLARGSTNAPNFFSNPVKIGSFRSLRCR